MLRVNLSDAIMMLEGGASGFDDVMLSGDDHEKYTGFEDGPVYTGFEGVSIDDMGKRIKGLGDTIKKRKYAICKAKVERKEHQVRLVRIESDIKRLVDALDVAKANNSTAKQTELEQEIIRLGSVRDIVAARALRFARTEALGSTLLTNAKTQKNVLVAAKMASARGAEDHAKTLVGAFNALAIQTKDLKELRKAQVQKWSAQTSAERVELGRTLLRRSRVMLDMLNRQRGAVTNPVAKAAIEKKIHDHSALQIKVAAKVNQEKANFEAKKNALPQDQRNTPAASASLKTIEKSAAIAGFLDGLDFSFSTITGGIKSAAGAVASAGKSVGSAIAGASKSVAGAVKKGVSAAYNAAKTIIKKGACLLGSNPQIAGAIAAAPNPAAQAAGAGLALASGVLKSACPGGKVATEDMVVGEDGSLHPAGGGLKKYIVPGAVVVGAGFLIMRATKK